MNHKTNHALSIAKLLRISLENLTMYQRSDNGSRCWCDEACFDEMGFAIQKDCATANYAMTRLNELVAEEKARLRDS